MDRPTRRPLHHRAPRFRWVDCADPSTCSPPQRRTDQRPLLRRRSDGVDRRESVARRELDGSSPARCRRHRALLLAHHFVCIGRLYVALCDVDRRQRPRDSTCSDEHHLWTAKAPMSRFVPSGPEGPNMVAETCCLSDSSSAFAASRSLRRVRDLRQPFDFVLSIVPSPAEVRRDPTPSSLGVGEFPASAYHKA